MIRSTGYLAVSALSHILTDFRPQVLIYIYKILECQTLSHNVASSTPRHQRDSNSQLLVVISLI